MKKSIISLGIIALILLSSCGTKTDPASDAKQIFPSQEQKAEDRITGVSGKYLPYDERLVGANTQTVLFFQSSECQSCIEADASFIQSTIPHGLIILKADFDTQKELKDKYEVNTAHTFVQIDSEGNLIKKWEGGSKVSDILGRL